jgi:hypothetical protein
LKAIISEMYANHKNETEEEEDLNEVEGQQQVHSLAILNEPAKEGDDHIEDIDESSSADSLPQWSEREEVEGSEEANGNREEPDIHIHESSRPGEPEEEEEEEPNAYHIAEMERDKDEEEQEERAEVTNPEKIEDIIGRMTARIDEEVEEVIQSWNDLQISPLNLEDALAPRTKTSQGIMDSQLTEKDVRLSKVFHAVLQKATKIMIKPAPDG